MDKLRTRVNIPEPAVKTGYTDKSLWMGSCFTETIGNVMCDLKFPVMINPFGTLFNPVSIGNNLLRLISGESFSVNDLRCHNNVWFSFSHYTGFSDPDREKCLSSINTALKTGKDWLQKCKFLFLTFGTATVYTFKENNMVVANCHKLPSSEFDRSMMQPGDITSLYGKVIEKLFAVNPDLYIVFTVSPVRHWSDGAITNQLSKSVLLCGIHELLSKYKHTCYFPAYEIFMDELRDYRFYATDMLHPSESGSNYVWERFSDIYIEEASKKIMTGVSAVLKASAHRPFNAETTNHKHFVEKTLHQIQLLTKSYPFLDFSNEIAKLQL